jgi:hypothetical protein
MTNKEILFFDLDNTLWFVKSDVWVIDKNEPSEPILRISPIEFVLIKNGIYNKNGYLVEYNGESYYISNDLVDRIQRKKKIRLKDIGISYAEYFDEDILNKKDVQLLLNNIKHIIGKDVEIGVLTARSDRKKHATLLNKLRVKLKEYGLEIDKIYFVSETIKSGGYFDRVLYNKNKVLLEHLVGLTIEDDKFIPIKKDAYNKVYFYDDIKSNIISANNLQEYFDNLILNSDEECVEYIKNRLENNDLILVNNLVTNNELNPFETTTIKLSPPIKYPIKVSDNKLTVKFENFRIN